MIPLLAVPSCHVSPGESAPAETREDRAGPEGEGAEIVAKPRRPQPGAHATERAEQFRRLDASTEAGLQRLIEGLDDPEPLVRGVSVLSLRDQAPRRVLTRLASSRPVPAGSGERRLLEIELLTSAPGFRPEPYAGALCRWAEEEALPELRARAASGCVATESPEPALVARFAADAHWSVRARTALALSRLVASGSREPEWNDLVARLADDPHPTVRNAARAPVSVAFPKPPARSTPQQGTTP